MEPVNIVDQTTVHNILTYFILYKPK